VSGNNRTRSVPPSARMRRRRKILVGAEWCFLIFGLIALDCCIWFYTSTSLNQAYQDWAFDQTLLGSRPSLPGFIAEEFRILFGGHRATLTPTERAQRLHPAPSKKPLRMGSLLGRLRITRLNLAAVVREGANESTLSDAVGHVPGTALPGVIGNIGLAGHRDTFFRPLAKVRKDDAIDLETDQGTFRYIVTSTEIVSPRDVNVLKASGGKTLTLVTCYPFYYVGSAPKRFIVHAVEASQPLRQQRGS
jgi:sortase A